MIILSLVTNMHKFTQYKTSTKVLLPEDSDHHLIYHLALVHLCQRNKLHLELANIQSSTCDFPLCNATCSIISCFSISSINQWVNTVLILNLINDSNIERLKNSIRSAFDFIIKISWSWIQNTILYIMVWTPAMCRLSKDLICFKSILWFTISRNRLRCQVRKTIFVYPFCHLLSLVFLNISTNSNVHRDILICIILCFWQKVLVLHTSLY